MLRWYFLSNVFFPATLSHSPQLCRAHGCVENAHGLCHLWLYTLKSFSFQWLSCACIVAIRSIFLQCANTYLSPRPPNRWVSELPHDRKQTHYDTYESICLSECHVFLTQSALRALDSSALGMYVYMCDGAGGIPMCMLLKLSRNALLYDYTITQRQRQRHLMTWSELWFKHCPSFHYESNYVKSTMTIPPAWGVWQTSKQTKSSHDVFASNTNISLVCNFPIMGCCFRSVSVRFNWPQNWDLGLQCCPQISIGMA